MAAPIESGATFRDTGNEDEHSDAWARQVYEGSMLYYAPASLLQSSPHARHILTRFREIEFLPDALFPDDIQSRQHDIRAIGWNKRTDAWFNYAEECADIATQLIWISLHDEATIYELNEALRIKDEVKLKESIRLSFEEKRDGWLEELIGDRDISPFVESFSEMVQRRAHRNAIPVVQSRERLWQKLLSQDGGSVRVGEIAELAQAAQVMRKDPFVEKHATLGTLDVDVLQLMIQAETQFDTNTVRDNDAFLRALSAFIPYVVNVFQVTRNIKIDVVSLALEKQRIRAAVGRNSRVQWRKEDHMDLRGIPKVLTALYLPYVISKYTPSLDELLAED